MDPNPAPLTLTLLLQAVEELDLDCFTALQPKAKEELAKRIEVNTCYPPVLNLES